MTEKRGKLEDESTEDLWDAYAATQLPPVEETGEFIRAQLRKVFFCGAWTMLALEERLRRETQERSDALLDRHRAECERAFEAMEGGRPAG